MEMIQANELRIGNWVMRWDGQPTRVDSVMELYGIDIECVSGYYGGSIESMDFDRINPISLTPEILEKAGFEMLHAPLKEETIHGTIKGLGGDFRYKDFVLVSGHHEWWYWGAPFNTRIKYVHQLQNLYFALSGEELQVKL